MQQKRQRSDSLMGSTMAAEIPMEMFIWTINILNNTNGLLVLKNKKPFVANEIFTQWATTNYQHNDINTNHIQQNTQNLDQIDKLTSWMKPDVLEKLLSIDKIDS